MTTCSGVDGVASGLLERLMGHVATKDVYAAEALLAADVRAAIPIDDGIEMVDRSRLVSWIDHYCGSTGLMRLDLKSVVMSTRHSAGAEVTHTAFRPQPSGQGASAGPDDGRPYWVSLPTIAAANASEAAPELEQLFFITDNPMQAKHEAKISAVLGWYTAYMDKDVEGFLARLSPQLEARSFNHYEPSTPVTKDAYHDGFVKWTKANRKGASLVDQAIANGAYVATSVQFLTESLEGQQKMTNEIHIIELDSDLLIRRAFFYETNLCGNPASPCAW